MALFGVDVHVVAVGTDGYFGSIGIEGEGGDRSNVKLVYLRGRHDSQFYEQDRTGRQSTVEGLSLVTSGFCSETVSGLVWGFNWLWII